MFECGVEVVAFDGKSGALRPQLEVVGGKFLDSVKISCGCVEVFEALCVGGNGQQRAPVGRRHEFVERGDCLLGFPEFHEGASADVVRVVMSGIDVEEVFRDLDGLLELLAVEQCVGQTAVGANGLRVGLGEVAQVLGGASVLRHPEQDQTSELACRLIFGIDIDGAVG